MSDPAKLPVWRTARTAYVRTFSSFSTLVRVAMVPFLLGYLGATAVGFIAGLMGHADQLFVSYSAWSLTAAFVSAFFMSMFALAWHRFFLLQPPDARTTVGIDIGKRGLVFFAYAVALLLMVMGPHMVGRARSQTDWIFTALILWPVYTAPFFARLNLVLPAAAIDRPISFPDSWMLTHRMSWRILSVLLLCGLPWGLAVQIIQLAYLPIISAGGLVGIFLVEVVMFILFFLQVAAVAAGLSLTYFWIRQRDEARQPQ